MINRAIRSAKVFFLIAYAMFIFGSVFSVVFAAAPPSGTFVVKPAKIELSLSPGELRETPITLSNGTSFSLHVDVSFEDVAPTTSANPSDDPVKLLGEEIGKYSLRDFIKTEKRSLDILSGQEAIVPVTISVPKGVEPGGRYGSVIFSFKPILAEDSQNAANVAVKSRIGSLFFVRVKGAVLEEGSLAAFGLFNDAKTARSPSPDNPLRFQVAFENKGNVHLNPYGRITVDPLFGGAVAIPIDPQAVLPGATRMREIGMITPLSIGYYRAHLDLNRGYQDIVDTRDVSFWIVPGLLGTFLIIIGLLLLLLLVRRSLRLSRNRIS